MKKSKIDKIKLNTIEGPITKRLLTYCSSDYTPWHMPGHKRNYESIFSNPYAYDVTEVPGLDDLHDPEDMILESLQMLAAMYQTKASYYLINGSTVGILASMAAAFQKGDCVLVGRNCHKSVFHAIELLELKPVYLIPEPLIDGHVLGEISAECVKRAFLENETAGKNTIKGVIITSPTYEGVVSDVAEIAKIAHAYQVPLIVDEAHGAHFMYHEAFPMSAVQLGADFVIQSLHKTLPAFTQTALLHVADDAYVDVECVKENLEIFETSSPSYPLLSSMETAVRFMWINHDKITEYVDKLCLLRQRIEELSGYELLSIPDMSRYDIGKVVIVPTHMSGARLGSELQERGHVVEMIAERYVIAMTSVCDDFANYDRLVEVLKEIDAKVNAEETIMADVSFTHVLKTLPEKCMEIGEAVSQKRKKNVEMLELKDAISKVAADYVYVYPPGYPILLPGERIGEDEATILSQYMTDGLNVKGIHGTLMRVIKE